MVSNCQLIEWISPISIVRASVLVSEKSKQSRMDPSRPFAAIFLHCNHTATYHTKQYFDNPYHSTLPYTVLLFQREWILPGHSRSFLCTHLWHSEHSTALPRKYNCHEKKHSRGGRTTKSLSTLLLRNDKEVLKVSTLLMINQSGLRTAAFCLLTGRTCSNALFFFQYSFIF